MLHATARSGQWNSGTGIPATTYSSHDPTPSTSSATLEPGGDGEALLMDRSIPGCLRKRPRLMIRAVKLCTGRTIYQGGKTIKEGSTTWRQKKHSGLSLFEGLPASRDL